MIINNEKKHTNKKNFGRYFTKSHDWLFPHLLKFINEHSDKNTVFFDPYAGEGDMLKAIDEKIKGHKLEGYDIDISKEWDINDSLKNIPSPKGNDNFLIITNPPFLAKNSATRNSYENAIYFVGNDRADIYMIALDKMIETGKYGVAIVPETFFHSSYDKSSISSITFTNKELFNDTDNPVCLITFGPEKSNDFKVYKDDDFVGNYSEITGASKKFFDEKNNDKISFNNKNGNLWLRAFDSANGTDKIEFFSAETPIFKNRKIKNTDRAISLIKVDNLDGVSKTEYKKFIDDLNKNLNEYRAMTDDIFLTPFKGNDKNGLRRKRLPFSTARKLIEKTESGLKK